MRPSQHTSCAWRRTSAVTQDSQGTSTLSQGIPTKQYIPIAHLRFSYGQFMSLFSKTVAERTKPGQRQDVEEKCTAPSALPWPSPYKCESQLTCHSILHIPCIWSHRRRRRNYHQRSRLSCPGCTSTALKSRRRVPLSLSSLHLRQLRHQSTISTAQAIP